MRPNPRLLPEWSSRWSQLARAAAIDPGARILIALSGGADSVLLLHLIAGAVPRPPVRAVHVQHGLRGDEAEGDARFCANLCRALGIPITVRRLALDPAQRSLEAHAREARYEVLLGEAARTRHDVLVTGHHSDDALETLLMRWIRGSDLVGAAGPRRRMTVRAHDPEGGPCDVEIVRPLMTMRREEVRRLLADRGLAWREDGSNADRRHTRNRLRLGFLPVLEELCGQEGLENLRAFGRAVEGLEESLAGATAHLAWAPIPHAAASRGPGELALGGTLARSGLMALAPPLRRRALWRLLVEGTGAAPGRGLLERIAADLGAGRCTRHSLPRAWTLVLRADELWLLPPPGRAHERDDSPLDGQRYLPFPGAREAQRAAQASRTLVVPGIRTLEDGRRISAEIVQVAPGMPVRGSGTEVELDAAGLPSALTIRWPAPGDRFRGLGAPGSKPILRFLADRGVPREERRRVPLVCAGDEIVWVVGFEPAERLKVDERTRFRLRLALHVEAPPLASWTRVRATGATGASGAARAGRGRARGPEPERPRAAAPEDRQHA